MELGSVWWIVLLSCYFSLRPATGQERCPSITNKPTCVCKYQHGIIDLTPLANTNNTPRFTKIQDPNRQDTFYSYNPCYKFKDVLCENCQVCSVTGPGSFDIGTAGTEAMYIESDGTPSLHYSTAQGGLPTEVTVDLKCTDLESASVVAKTSDAAFYTFELSSCHACPGGCAGGRSTHKKVATGLIGIGLILLFIVALAVYFVIGAVILKVKSAGTEMIPNKNFWKDLPFLVKDGFVFTFGPIVEKIRSRGRNDYAPIK